MGVLFFQKNVQFLKIVHVKLDEAMYMGNPIIKGKNQDNIKFDCSSQLRGYFFCVISKRALNPFYPIVFCAYSVKNHVFAQLLGFTTFFLYGINYS